MHKDKNVKEKTTVTQKDIESAKEILAAVSRFGDAEILHFGKLLESLERVHQAKA